jgi:hypothetical protein
MVWEHRPDVPFIRPDRASTALYRIHHIGCSTLGIHDIFKACMYSMAHSLNRDGAARMVHRNIVLSATLYLIDN